MADSTRTIWRSASRFFSGTMLSRVTGMLRDMTMAFAFGTQSSVAALLVAFRFAHLLRRLLGEGAMQTALIPHFEELRTQDPTRAGKFFCDLAVSLSHLLTLFILLTMAGLGGLLALDFLSPGNAEIVWLTLLMMPSLLFICLFGINASLLQCEKHYFVPSAAPVVFNLFWMVGIVCAYFFASSQAMTTLSLFIIAACFAQWAITLPKVYTILKGYGVNTLWKGSRRYSNDVLNLGKPLALGIVGIAASQINNAFDAVFARWADSEGPAILWYAIRLQQLPLALFGIAIAGALLPPLARAIKAHDIVQYNHFLKFALWRTLAFMIPITAALFIMGDSCIALIYGHGNFDNTSVVSTTQALWGYTFGLIPMALILILAPAFYARGNYRTPSMAATAAMGINIGLNTILVAGFGLGAASIAFATSVSAWINLAWLSRALKNKGIALPLWNETGKIFAVSCVAMLAVVAVDQAIWGTATVVELVHGIIPFYEKSVVSQMLRLGISGVTFFGVLGLAFLGHRFFTASRLNAMDSVD